MSRLETNAEAFAVNAERVSFFAFSSICGLVIKLTNPGSWFKAAGIIDRAKQNGEQQKASIVNAANEEVKTMKANAKKDIQQEKQDALSSVKNDVAELSIEIASKIIQKELTPESQKELVDSYIEGLGKQNGNR